MLNRRQVRKSAKTRSWERANADARVLEQRLEAAERGEVIQEAKARITVSAAIARYLDAKGISGIGSSALRKQKGIMGLLAEFCQKHNRIFLDEVSADDLAQWRSSWKLKVYPGGQLSFSWKVRWAIVGSLFRYAVKFGWIQHNEAAKLDGFRIKRRQVQPFSPKEMTAILKGAEGDSKTKTFILLMRWSGLSCGDAGCLPRAALDTQGRIHTRRRKTGTDVFVPLPPFVADALRALTNDNPEYFFWDGKIGRESQMAQWQVLLRQVFDAAKVPDATSHRFRHTFAVELLKAGVPIEETSKLLGHESVSTTEKHYSAWVTARQTRLEGIVREAWTQMGVR